VLLSMTLNQLVWLGLSSLAILVYHVNLALLCTLSTSTTVGIVETLRPAPAFGIIVLTQGVQGQKGALFWIGSAVILISTIIFHLPHPWQVMRTNQGSIHNQSGQPVRISIPNKMAGRDWRKCGLSSTSPERTRLLDHHVMDENS
jgi:hypothetical protein